MIKIPNQQQTIPKQTNQSNSNSNAAEVKQHLFSSECEPGMLVANMKSTFN